MRHFIIYLMIGGKANKAGENLTVPKIKCKIYTNGGLSAYFFEEVIIVGQELNITKIYFKRVPEPQKNKIYFQFDDGNGFPVMIIDGAFLRNDRTSNAWTWRNLLTGRNESGYGCFYEALSRETNGENIFESRGIENSFVSRETNNYLENLSYAEKMWSMVLLCFMLTGGDKFSKNKDELDDKSGGKNGVED